MLSNGLESKNKASFGSLSFSEPAVSKDVNQSFRRTFRTLPHRERCIINLIYNRGATVAEVAGLLGISRTGLTRILTRGISRVTNPFYQALANNWDRLTPRHRRLLYLHRVLDISLATIARDGLMTPVDGAGPTAPPDTLWTLRRELREAMRQIELHQPSAG
jgi:DNA-directed RNA polymerase specialized sigma24 family protein